MIHSVCVQALSYNNVPKALLGFAGIALFGAAIWLAAVWQNEQRLTMKRDENVQEIISMLDLRATPDFHLRVDTLRIFINDNSDHEIDETFWANYDNPTAFASGLLALC
jgi:hypothetical protein